MTSHQPFCGQLQIAKSPTFNHYHVWIFVWLKVSANESYKYARVIMMQLLHFKLPVSSEWYVFLNEKINLKF
jgi:hypothetical protein